MKRIKTVAVGLLAAAGLSGCFQNPEMLKRTHAYEGPIRKDAEIATIFGQVNNGYTTICKLDDVSLRSFGYIVECPAVIYALPGKHTLQVNYALSDGYRTQSAAGSLSIGVVAGGIYRVSTSTDLVARKARFYIAKMPDDFVLTYKDIAPDFFRRQPNLVNTRVDSQHSVSQAGHAADRAPESQTSLSASEPQPERAEADRAPENQRSPSASEPEPRARHRAGRRF